MIGFLEKHRRKVVWIYIVLTFIKFFTANIYLVREEDPTIYFKLVPTIQNTFYRGGDDSATHEYYKEVHSWYENDQYWEIFHSPGGMQDIIEVCYDIVIGAWWVLSAALISFALYHLLKRKKSPSTTKTFQDDWRNRGQLDYLKGKRIEKQIFSSSPDWDHEHCEFCWNKISENMTGYCTVDKKSWICSSCYEELKELFEW